MGDSPATTNATATIANDFIHKIIFDVAVQAAEKTLETAYPFLNWPIVNQIEHGIVNAVAQEIYLALAKGVTFSIIDSQVNAEAKAANEAKDTLKDALKKGEASAIELASKKFDDAFGKLVHLDGSATP